MLCVCVCLSMYNKETAVISSSQVHIFESGESALMMLTEWNINIGKLGVKYRLLKVGIFQGKC